MPVIHMVFWTIVVIAVLTLWRLRSWREVAVVTLISSVILFFSQIMFWELAAASGVEPGLLVSDNAAILQAGPFGWLALLVMPLGWLAPIIGAGLVQRWQAVGQPA